VFARDRICGGEFSYWYPYGWQKSLLKKNSGRWLPNGFLPIGCPDDFESIRIPATFFEWNMTMWLS